MVLQTVLPALLTASSPSTIRITGGTHNKASPPVDFLQRTYLSLVECMGPKVELELLRYGFYPRGGGEIVARVTPSARLMAITLNERGARKGAAGHALTAGAMAGHGEERPSGHFDPHLRATAAGFLSYVSLVHVSA